MEDGASGRCRGPLGIGRLLAPWKKNFLAHTAPRSAGRQAMLGNTPAEPGQHLPWAGRGALCPGEGLLSIWARLESTVGCSLWVTCWPGRGFSRPQYSRAWLHVTGRTSEMLLPPQP